MLVLLKRITCFTWLITQTFSALSIYMFDHLHFIGMFDYLHFMGMLITAFHGICHPCLHDFMVTNCSYMLIVILWYSPLGCDVKRNIVVFPTWL